MNKARFIKNITLTILFCLAFSVSNNLSAKRMQFIKQKQFCYTKGKTTSTIRINFITATKFIGELTVATEGEDDAKTVGINGTETGSLLNKNFNDEPPAFAKGMTYSKQAWKIVKLKSGEETLQVKYYLNGKKRKYVKYVFLLCDVKK